MIPIERPLSRVNWGRFFVFSTIRCSDGIVTMVYCSSPNLEGQIWVRKLMEIIGVSWTIVLLTPPTIIVFLIGFSVIDDIEKEIKTSRHSYLKWIIRFLCSVGVGDNLWGPISWLVRSGLLSTTSHQTFTIGCFSWFVVSEEILWRIDSTEE